MNTKTLAAKDNTCTKHGGCPHLIDSSLAIRFRLSHLLPIENQLSIVRAEADLRLALRHADSDEFPANDPELRHQRYREIRAMLDEYAVLFKQLDDYYETFFSAQNRPKWEWSEAFYRYDERDPLETYNHGADKRLAIVRRELGLAPQQNTDEL